MWKVSRWMMTGDSHMTKPLSCYVIRRMVLGGELPTVIVFVAEFTPVMFVDDLRPQKSHSTNQGELNHNHDSWVVHHQVGSPCMIIATVVAI